MNISELTTSTVKELKTEAKAQNIKNYSKMKRDELIDVLKAKFTDIEELSKKKAKANNVQFSNLISRKDKLITANEMRSLSKVLKSTKNTNDSETSIDETSYDNLVFLQQCTKAVNVLTKGKHPELLTLFAEVYFIGKTDKKSKDGQFNKYRVNQLLQKMVRIADNKCDGSYNKALLVIKKNK